MTCNIQQFEKKVLAISQCRKKGKGEVIKRYSYDFHAKYSPEIRVGDKVRISGFQDSFKSFKALFYVLFHFWK